MKKIILLFTLLFSFGVAYSQELVEDIWPGNSSSLPNTLYGVNGDIYFLATPEITKSYLYKIEESTGNLVTMTTDILAVQIIGHLGNELIFAATEESSSQFSIYKTNGTPGNYEFIKTYPDWYGYGELFTSGTMINYTMNDILYFWVFTEDTGYELMRTDGTESGTFIIKDIFPGEEGSLNTWAMSSSFFGEKNNNLYFNAMHPDYGSELWKTDGTEAGTVLVKDIDPSPVYEDMYFLGGSPGEFANYKNSVYFTALNPDDGHRIFKTDGTESGTTMVINNISYPSYLRVYNGSLYFVGYDDNSGVATVYKSDGTQSGTQILKNPTQGGPTNVSGDEFTIFDNKLYFVASSESSWESTLWYTDGTSSGTATIPNPSNIEYFPEKLYATSDYLYFFGEMSNGNNALYRLGKNSTTIEQVSANNFSCNPDEIIINNDGCLIITGYYNFDYDEEVYKICDQNTDPLAIAEEEISSLSIFPNPSTDRVTIANVNTNEIENIQLYNLTGQATNLAYTVKNDSEITINGLSKYSSGVYILSLRLTNGSSQTSKLIIE